MDVGLYWHFVRLRMRERMEYRGAYLLGIGAQVIGWGGDYAVIAVLLQRFPALNGWTLPEIVFLFSLELFTYAVAASLVYSAMTQLDTLVAEGTLDTYLVRPLDPLAHLAARWYNPGHAAHLAIAAAFLVWSVGHVDISWSAPAALYFALAVVGAVCLQAAFLLVLGSLSFVWVRASHAFVLYFTVKSFVSYPVTLYGVAVQWLLTLVVPLAFVNFYPAALLLGKDGGVLPPPLLWAAPLVGPCALLAASRFFCAGLGRYQGAGG